MHILLCNGLTLTYIFNCIKNKLEQEQLVSNSEIITFLVIYELY